MMCSSNISNRKIQNKILNYVFLIAYQYPLYFYTLCKFIIINPCPAEPGYSLPCKQCRSGSALFAIKYVNL